jgi:hypothetical protein
MPLGRYAKVLEAIDELPPEVTKELAGLDKISTEAFIGKLPVLLAKSFPKIIKALSGATGIDEETLNNEFDLVDGVKVLKAVFEVNDFKLIKNELVAAFQQKTEANATKEPEIKNG